MKNLLLTCSLASAIAIPSISQALVVNVTEDNLSISTNVWIDSAGESITDSDSFAGNGLLGGDVESFRSVQTDDYYQEGKVNFNFTAPNEIYHTVSAFSAPETTTNDTGYARVRTSWDVAFNTEGGGILDLVMMNTNLDLPEDPTSEAISWGSYQVTDTLTGIVLADTANGSFNSLELADGGSYSLSMSLNANSHWDEPAFFTASFFDENFSKDISVVDGTNTDVDPVAVPSPAGLPLILLSLFGLVAVRRRR